MIDKEITVRIRNIPVTELASVVIITSILLCQNFRERLITIVLQLSAFAAVATAIGKIGFGQLVLNQP